MELCSLPAIYLGPGGSDGKASVYNVGDLGSIPGLGSSLEKEMATHSSTLAEKITWMAEPDVHGVAKSWTLLRDFTSLGGSDSKASACNAGNPGSIPGSGRSPGEGNGNPL